MTTIDSATAAFAAERPLLLSVAYRLLGSVADAEDVVQEAYVRWQSVDHDKLDSQGAYLTTVVTRLSLDVLKSARVRREVYVGPWLPEPLPSPAAGPAELAELADSLSMAFLVVLETLSPLERAAFVLHDVFQYGYADVASAVGREEAACRQLVSRARRHIAARRPRYTARVAATAELTERFRDACTSGDIDSLLELLADDAVLLSDGGGAVTAARLPVVGAEKVATFLTRVFGRGNGGRVAGIEPLNGAPAIVMRVDGEASSAICLDVDGNRIVNVHIVRNPEKLARL